MSSERGGHGLGPTRARVLGLLQGEGGISVQDTAESLGIHNNTARFHLEALVESGFAVRDRDEPHGQGRPRTLYSATGDAPRVDTGHLRDFTQVLVRQLILTAPEPQRLAEDVGRSWGAEVGLATLSGRTGIPEPDDLVALLEHTSAMGFGGVMADPTTVEFRSCPYRNMGQPTRDSICHVHLGMLRGFLDARGSDLEVAGLTPGAICVARLSLRRNDDTPA